MGARGWISLALSLAVLRGCAAHLLPPDLCARLGCTATAPSLPSGPPTLHAAANPRLGPILEDAAGSTVYLSVKDPPDESLCRGACEATWQPLAVPPGVRPTCGCGGGNVSFLGVIRRAHGMRQVTFAGSPLYLYVPEAGRPGSTAGNGLDDAWYAVRVTGGPAVPPIRALDLQSTLWAASTAALGTILVDQSGMTLYVHTLDAPGISRCTGACAVKWPPLTFPGPPQVQWHPAWRPLLLHGPGPAGGPGVTGRLGLLKRAGGRAQVTINGQPLYLFSGDRTPGQTAGENLDGVWFAVRPSGAQV